MIEKLKILWNKQVTTKQKFYSGLMIMLGFTPLMVYVIWFEMVDMITFWIVSCWGAFLGWTVVTYVWRHEFKDSWDHKLDKNEN